MIERPEFGAESLREARLDERLDARIHSYELAFRMQTEASDAFDLSKEPAAIRELYGNTVHGRQTLIARRLLERGVRYVQLWHGAGQPWDNHDDLAENHRRLADQCSQSMGALLKDLKQRGLLDETLVIWGGEFGRTPKINKDAGRDHWAPVSNCLLAGGGMKPGVTLGESDDFGFNPANDPVHVHDFQATVLHLLGIDPHSTVPNAEGRPMPLTGTGNVRNELLG